MVTIIPATKTPATIEIKDFFNLMLSNAAITEPEYAPVPGKQNRSVSFSVK